VRGLMKALAAVAAVGVTAMAGATPAGAASSNSEVSPRAFHDRLTPYGHWFEHPRWGQVWHPTEVPAGFRPYRDGHWENSSEYGTVWVSDYSADADEKGRWGDIVFHYGRWGYDPQYGWLWAPGYTWSPGWVVWRQGAGNIGWLPMPPGTYDGVGDYPDDWAGWYGYRGWYGPALSDAAFFGMWSFVPAADIYAPVIGVDIIAPGAYGGFIGRTAAWTRYDVVGGHIVNRSIDAIRFHAAFGRDLPAVTRNDFLAHHGLVVGLDRSRRLESAGHGYLHAGFSAGGHIAGVRAHSGMGYAVSHETHHHSTPHEVRSDGIAGPAGRGMHGESPPHAHFQMNGAQMSGHAQHHFEEHVHPAGGGSNANMQHPKIGQPANAQQHHHH